MAGKKDGDVVMILTTDTIIKVMEAYLNTHELRRKVQVVNLQAKGDAYAFSLEYIEEAVDNSSLNHYNKILDNAASVHQYGVDIPDEGWKERQVPIVQQPPLSKEDAAWIEQNSQPVQYPPAYADKGNPYGYSGLEYERYKAGKEYPPNTMLDFDISQEPPMKVIPVKRSKNGQFTKVDAEKE